MARKAFTLAVAGIASVGLLVFGAIEAASEIAPYLGNGYTIEDRFAALANGALPVGHSRFSRVGFLNECADVAGSLFGVLQPQQEQERLADSCLNQLNAMVQAAPTDGQAWTAIAEMYALKRDVPSLRQALLRSREGAPNLAVLARWRVRLGDDWVTDPTAEELAGRDADLLVMLRSWAALPPLAERYLARPDDREAMLALFQNSPADEQKRFLDEVKKQAARQ